MNEPFDQEEIKIEPGEKASEAYVRVFNNFHLLFRLGERPHDPAKLGLSAEGQYRMLSRYVNRLDISHETFFADATSERIRERQMHGPLWLRQTDAEFFAEIDRTIVEVGMKPADVAEAINSFALGELAGAAREKALAGLYFMLAPIYGALRRKGYTPRDLTA